MEPKHSPVDGDPYESNDGQDPERDAASASPAVKTLRKLSSASNPNLRRGYSSPLSPDESTSLLRNKHSLRRSYTSSRIPSRITSAQPTPRQGLTRSNSFTNTDRVRRHHQKTGSVAMRLANALGASRSSTWSKAASLVDSSLLPNDDDRMWYDQFTSIDWVHDNITDALRHNDLKSRRDFRGRAMSFFYGAQGWFIPALVGFLFAGLAYCVVVAETSIFDVKFGYCQTGWFRSQKSCCAGVNSCDSWLTWGQIFGVNAEHALAVDFAVYLLIMIILSVLACMMTMATAIVVPSHVTEATLRKTEDDGEERFHGHVTPHEPPKVFYSAAGSGVAEVRVILSGFILHQYLGVKTLVAKTLGLVLSVASGLTVGKEGPYVHIATCLSNVVCRFFAKYNRNDAKKREVLSAGAASGVAIAFGAPISGVLFSLEEVSYYFPAKTLFRTFFCCIIAALSLKAFNPYGTNRIVMFQVHYTSDWRAVEMFAFILLGVVGGAVGALFIKATRLWARTFRQFGPIKRSPVLEIILVATVSGVISYWNRYTKLPVADLLWEVASECSTFEETSTGLCPTRSKIPGVVGYLSVALVVKALLTTITFGTKVPGGIYVPSMVVGGLIGRIFGHVLQYFIMTYTTSNSFGHCTKDGNPESCIVPGVYALVAAGATMCGVTRLSVTLVVILFELTGSLDHVLPFSIAVMVSKWTADAIEPLSIYDLLTESNAYPFLDQKYRPIMTGELGDITPRFRNIRVVNITESPVVPAHGLRQRLEFIRGNGEIDGGIPIVRDGMLVGIVPAPDLEFALDRLEDEENTMCLMSSKMQYHDDELHEGEELLDFTPYIDESPIALDLHSSMELAYELFVKLGLRYIGVHRDGYYVGLVHKKAFVKYLRDLKKES